MEKEIKKISYKVLSFVLCLCIVSGAAAPAYADSTTQAYNYYGITLGDGSTPILTPVNSADMIGYVLSVLSSNQKAIYNKISSSGGNDYSSVLSNIFGTLSNLNNKFNAAVVSGTDKLFFVGDTLSYINKPVWTDGEGIGEQLQAYMSAMSYNLVSVYNKIDNVKTDTANLSGIKTDTANLSGIKIDTANLSGIKTDTANLSGIKSDTSNLSAILTGLTDFKTANHTDITSFNDDYNDIDWVNAGSYIATYTTFNGTDIAVQGANNSPVYPTISINPSFSIYNVRIPVSFRNFGYLDGELKVNAFYLNSRNERIDIPVQVVAFNQQYSYTDLIIYFGSNSAEGFNIRLEVYSDNDYIWVYNSSSVNSKVRGINFEKKDFYDVQSFLYNFNILNLFEQAKEVFFDDKTIAAKKANQDQEDTVLSNFTGSGAASASVSDFGAVKDSMVDLKAGFTGGASSSDTFSFLNGDSNAWDWFTQDTANDVDRTQRSNTRLLRGSSSVASDTPLLDSYYNSILSILVGDE